MIKFSKHIFSFLLFLITFHSYTQEKQFIAKTAVKENAVLLRWAPSDKDLWKTGMQNGYRILKTELNTLKPAADTDFTNAIVIAESVLPYSEKDTAWMDVFRRDKNAFLVYKAMYEKAPPSSGKQDMGDRLYGMSMLSAGMNAGTAKAMGLYFKDTLAGNKKIYAYKIELTNPPKDKKIKSAYVTVDASVITVYPPVQTLKAKFSGKKVTLYWNALDLKNDYSCFVVEQSEDSVQFKKVNRSPLVFLATEWEKGKKEIFYTDTLPQTGKKYYYRVKGIDHFGEEGPPSIIVSGIAYELLKGFPVIDSTYMQKDGKARIIWKITNAEDESAISGILIAKSKTIRGKYEILNKAPLQPSTKIFTDEELTASRYYKVIAIGRGGDTVESYPALAVYYDAVPPQVPSGLKGTINAKGNIHLSWTANPEPDLKGYRVFRSNSLEEEFSEVTKKIITKTEFRDSVTLNTLTRNVYYKVTAVDESYNNSVFSDVIKIERPDTIPPIPVIIKEAYSGKRGVELKWICSNSRDVEKYFLYRWKEGEKENILKDWSPADSLQYFSDTTVFPGVQYNYKIVCSDAGDNFSVSNAVPVIFENGSRPKPASLRAEANRNEKLITLHWQKIQGDVYSIVIYKSRKGEALRSYKTISPEEAGFSDTHLYMNTVYQYQLKVVFRDGAESYSEVVEVEY